MDREMRDGWQVDRYMYIYTCRQMDDKQMIDIDREPEQMSLGVFYGSSYLKRILQKPNFTSVKCLYIANHRYLKKLLSRIDILQFFPLLRWN